MIFNQNHRFFISAATPVWRGRTIADAVKSGPKVILEPVKKPEVIGAEKSRVEPVPAGPNTRTVQSIPAVPPTTPAKETAKQSQQDITVQRKQKPVEKKDKITPLPKEVEVEKVKPSCKIG